MANFKTGISRKQSAPNFPKDKYFLPPDTHTYLCESGRGDVRFSENLARFVFLKHPFRDSPFCIITNALLIRKTDHINTNLNYLYLGQLKDSQAKLPYPFKYYCHLKITFC